jgi:hypothetical protein
VEEECTVRRNADVVVCGNLDAIIRLVFFIGIVVCGYNLHAIIRLVFFIGILTYRTHLSVTCLQKLIFSVLYSRQAVSL